jgi:hypothetical protein
MSDVQIPYEACELGNTHGRAPVEITCPFCATVFTAYKWSLAGSGKRCPGCRAMFSLWGATSAAAWKALTNRRGDE